MMSMLSSAEMRWCKVHQDSPLWPTATPQASLLVTESLLLCLCYPAQASQMLRYCPCITHHTLHSTNGFLYLRRACIQVHSISSVLNVFPPTTCSSCAPGLLGRGPPCHAPSQCTSCHCMQQTLTCMLCACLHVDALHVAILYGNKMPLCMLHACTNHGSFTTSDRMISSDFLTLKIRLHLSIANWSGCIIASWLQHMLPPYCRTVVLCRWTAQERTFPAASLQWMSLPAPLVKYALHVISLLQQRVCVFLDHTFISTGTARPCLTPEATPVSFVHFAEREGRLGRHPICVLGMCIMLCACYGALSILVSSHGLPDAVQSPGQLCSTGVKLTSGTIASSSALVSPFTLSANHNQCPM